MIRVYVSDDKKKGKERKGTLSQVGYISPIWGADPYGPISTKIDPFVGVDDIVIHSNFGVNILWVSDIQGRGVQIFIFPLTLLIILTTVLPLPRSL